jgi:hypothetical protein
MKKLLRGLLLLSALKLTAFRDNDGIIGRFNALPAEDQAQIAAQIAAQLAAQHAMHAQAQRRLQQRSLAISQKPTRLP